LLQPSDDEGVIEHGDGWSGTLVHPRALGRSGFLWVRHPSGGAPCPHGVSPSWGAPTGASHLFGEALFLVTEPICPGPEVDAPSELDNAREADSWERLKTSDTIVSELL
jgi:hypothetical protein